MPPQANLLSATPSQLTPKHFCSQTSWTKQNVQNKYQFSAPIPLYLPTYQSNYAAPILFYTALFWISYIRIFNKYRPLNCAALGDRLVRLVLGPALIPVSLPTHTYVQQLTMVKYPVTTFLVCRLLICIPNY